MSKIVYTCIAFLCCSYLSAQVIVTPSTYPPYTPINLISNVFLGEGVEVQDIKYLGNREAVGAFSNGQATIGLDEGIVLSTGIVDSISNANWLERTTSSTSSDNVVDADLEALVPGYALNDIAKYEITFVPFNDTLEFRYVFGSEEYPEFVCADYNDVFAFFISGPKPGGGNYFNKNIALIPDPADPTGQTFLNRPVTINNVNSGVIGTSGNPDISQCSGTNGSLAFSQYYNETAFGDYPVFDAVLDIFIAQAVVIPCETYTIKIAIGDVSDDGIDSGVFLEAKSFGTGTIGIDVQTSSIDGNLAEGCQTADIVFSIPEALPSDYIMDFNLIEDSSLPSPALQGVDYVSWPSQIIVPAGSTSVSVSVDVIADGISEGDEFIYLDAFKNICFRDTIRIVLKDDLLEEIRLPQDITICEGDVLDIVPILPPGFEVPPIPSFRNGQDIIISLDSTEYKSTINVTGVIPQKLNQSIFKSICIDTFIGRNLNDFDFFLVGPGDRILELSTDNGLKTNGSADIDTFLNTCFTVDATMEIENGNVIEGPFYPSNPNYTGNFQPEGNWNNFLRGPQANGAWSLVVIADTEQAMSDIDDGNSALKSWSICFNPSYTADFVWTANGQPINCNNCQSLSVSPTDETMYKLELTDSYGCGSTDSIRVSTVPDLGSPTDLTCDPDNISYNNILYTWTSIPTATSYEIRIDGMNPWINIGNVDSYNLTGLLFSQEIQFELRAINAYCESDIVTVTCTTLDCPPPILESILPIGTSCFGVPDGMVTVSAIGGSGGPYTFYLEDEVNTSGVFTNLPVGEYAVAIEDNVGCRIEFDFEIIEPPDITVAIDKEDITCHDFNDGNICVAASGDFPPFTYNWNVAGDVDKLNNLSEGWYVVTTTDANNCERVDSIFIENPTILEITQMDKVDVSCYEGTNGEASVMYTGGRPPYIVRWSNTIEGDAISNLTTGMYVVTVTDMSDCEAIDSIFVDEPDRLIVNAIGNQVTCFSSIDGVAYVDIAGGTMPYEILWEDGSTTDTIKNLNGGDYDVLVTDFNGCQTNATATIISPPMVPINAVVTDARCHESEDGRIDIDINPPGYSLDVLWEDQTSNPSLIGLGAATYCVTVTDQDQCTNETCFEIRDPNQIQVVETVTQVSCIDVTDGSISISVNGGTPDYAYSWDGPGIFVSQDKDIQDLEQGDYSLTITDINDCTEEFQFNIGIERMLSLEFLADTIECNGSFDGSVTLIVDGGVGPYGYQWNGPAPFTADTKDLSGIQAGEYSVIVTDINGCMIEGAVQVTERSANSFDIMTEDVFCFGDDSGKAYIIGNGPGAPYSYLWSSGEVGDSATTYSAGGHSVVATDAYNCIVELFFDIGQPEQGVVADITATDISCVGSSDGMIEVNATGGSGVYMYKVEDGDFTASNIIIGLDAGLYTVVIQDLDGCEFSIDSVEISDISNIGLDLGDDIFVDYGASLTLNPSIGGNQEEIEYFWTAPNVDNFDCLDCENPMIRNITVPFEAKLKVINKAKCEAEDNIKVWINKETTVSVPTGFTPNGDGNNDFLIVFGKENITINSFEVFSRWGEKMYSSYGFTPNDEANAWDGRHNNELVNPGTYVWTMEILYEDGRTERLNGNTQLIR